MFSKYLKKRKKIGIKNILLKRIFSLKTALLAYSASSIIDLITIALASKIFSILISQELNYSGIVFACLCFLIIILRAFLVYTLRRYSFSKILEKKSNDESKIVKRFIQQRIYSDLDDEENTISSYKENLINSSNVAAINFDIPVISLSAEILFAIGGILFLIRNLGVKIFIFNFPLFFILLLFSRYVAKKLHRLGKIILKSTEERLRSIDNVAEISIELSALKKYHPLLKNFSRVNNPFNKIMSDQLTTSNMMQISIESSALIIILISIISVITNSTNTSLANSASALAVLSRMVPSITRSIAFFAQLQFGITPVLRLAKLGIDDYHR